MAHLSGQAASQDPKERIGRSRTAEVQPVKTYGSVGEVIEAAKAEYELGIDHAAHRAVDAAAYALLGVGRDELRSITHSPEAVAILAGSILSAYYTFEIGEPELS